MNTSQIPLVICLTVFIVVGVNAALLVALRRGNEAGQIELLKRAAGRARQPWVHEDEALKELSKRVAELKRGEGAGDRRESASPGGADREHRGEPRDHASQPEGTEE